MFQLTMVRDNRTDTLVRVNVVEGEVIQLPDINMAINDPCLALFMYRHPDATWSWNQQTTAIELCNWYNEICEEDDFDKPAPGELMIGKRFKVRCWNRTHFPGCNDALVDKIYEVEIREAFGFGTDGFYIPELGMIVDTPLMALQHFVIA